MQLKVFVAHEYVNLVMK